MNRDKVTSPSRSPKYLGVIIDLEKMRFRIPEEKLVKTTQLVKRLMSKRYCSHKDLERLTGYLAQISVLVKGGRTFCRRLYSLLKATAGKRRITLGEVYKSDLTWWDKFLRVFKGFCEIFPRSIIPNHVFTDASVLDSGRGTGISTCFGFGVLMGSLVIMFVNHL